jgi:hypothetical protein
LKLYSPIKPHCARISFQNEKMFSGVSCPADKLNMTGEASINQVLEKN